MSYINFTYLVLISKIQSTTRTSDFKPIGLCNIVYKLIAKDLSNRLQLVLPHLIHSSQYAFVSGRLITDNVIVTFESFHSLQTVKNGSYQFMGLKLDMRKAYDRIE